MKLIKSNSWWMALIGLLFLIPCVFQNLTFVNIMIEVLIGSLFGVSLNLLLGYTGLLSLGHCAFFAIGSYCTGILIREMSLSVPYALAIGMVLGGGFAFFMGYFCTRLTQFYFSFLTLAFSQIIYIIVMRLSITGGAQGLMGGIPNPSIRLFGWVIDLVPRLNFYYFTVILVCGSFILCKVIVDSPFGWILRCIRENQMRTQFIGINTRRYQVAIFMIAGIFGTLAGGLTALNIGGAYPEHAHWLKGADPIFMILIGGMKNFFGPIVGAAIMLLLNSYITVYTRYVSFFLGATLILIIVFARIGIVDFLVLKKEIWGKAHIKSKISEI